MDRKEGLGDLVGRGKRGKVGARSSFCSTALEKIKEESSPQKITNNTLKKKKTDFVANI